MDTSLLYGILDFLDVKRKDLWTTDNLLTTNVLWRETVHDARNVYVKIPCANVPVKYYIEYQS